MMIEDDHGVAGTGAVVGGGTGRQRGAAAATVADNDDHKMSLDVKQQQQQHKQQLQLPQPDTYPTRQLQEDEMTPMDTTSTSAAGTTTTTSASDNNVVGRVSVLGGDTTTWTSPRQSSTATTTTNSNKDPILEDKDDAERPFLDFDRQNDESNGDLVTTTNLRPGGGSGSNGLGGGLGGATAYFPDLVARVSYLVGHVQVPSSSASTSSTSSSSGVTAGTDVSQSRQQPPSLTATISSSSSLSSSSSSTISSPFPSYQDGLIKAMDVLATKIAPEFFNENNSGVVVTKVTSGIINMKVEQQPTATATTTAAATAINDDGGGGVDDDESSTTAACPDYVKDDYDVCEQINSSIGLYLRVISPTTTTTTATTPSNTGSLPTNTLDGSVSDGATVVQVQDPALMTEELDAFQSALEAAVNNNELQQIMLDLYNAANTVPDVVVIGTTSTPQPVQTPVTGSPTSSPTDLVTGSPTSSPTIIATDVPAGTDAPSASVPTIPTPAPTSTLWAGVGGGDRPDNNTTNGAIVPTSAPTSVSTPVVPTLENGGDDDSGRDVPVTNSVEGSSLQAQEDGGMTTGAMAGVAVAILVCVVAIASFVKLRRTRRNRNNNAPSSTKKVADPENPQDDQSESDDHNSGVFVLVDADDDAEIDDGKAASKHDVVPTTVSSAVDIPKGSDDVDDQDHGNDNPDADNLLEREQPVDHLASTSRDFDYDVEEKKVDDLVRQTLVPVVEKDNSSSTEDDDDDDSHDNATVLRSGSVTKTSGEDTPESLDENEVDPSLHTNEDHVDTNQPTADLDSDPTEHGGSNKSHLDASNADQDISASVPGHHDDADDKSSPQKEAGTTSLELCLEQIDEAVMSGDWAAVGATAALLAATSTTRKESISFPRQKRRTSNSSATALDSEKSQKAAELNSLVQAQDWNALVQLAAKFDAESVALEELSRVSSVLSRTSSQGSETYETSNTIEDSSRISSARSRSSSQGSDTYDASSNASTYDYNSRAGRSSIHTTGTQSDRKEEIRSEVEKLVIDVVPEEYEHIDEMMTQFKGKEEELIETLRTMKERDVAQKARVASQKLARRNTRENNNRQEAPDVTTSADVTSHLFQPVVVTPSDSPINTTRSPSTLNSSPSGGSDSWTTDDDEIGSGDGGNGRSPMTSGSFDQVTKNDPDSAAAAAAEWAIKRSLAELLEKEHVGSAASAENN